MMRLISGAVKGDAEKVVHALRAWTAHHAGSSGKVFVKLDFSKAFACVSRDGMLLEGQWVTNQTCS